MENDVVVRRAESSAPTASSLRSEEQPARNVGLQDLALIPLPSTLEGACDEPQSSEGGVRGASARLARKVTPRTTLMQDLFREKGG